MYGKQQLVPGKASYSDDDIASMSKYWSTWHRSLLLGTLMRIFGDPANSSMHYAKSLITLLRDHFSDFIAELGELFYAALRTFMFFLACICTLVCIVTWPVWFLARILYRLLFGSADAAIRSDCKILENLKYDKPTNTWLRKQKGGVW